MGDGGGGAGASRRGLLMGRIFAWLGRQGVLLLLIVAALAFYQFAWPLVRPALTVESVRGEWVSMTDVAAELASAKTSALARLQTDKESLSRLTDKRLRDARAARRTELHSVENQLGKKPGFLGGLRPSVILSRERLKLRRGVLQVELAVLDGASDAEARQAAIRSTRGPKADYVESLRVKCDKANADVAAFNAKSLPEKVARNQIGGEANRLTQNARKRCQDFIKARGLRRKALDQYHEAMADYRKAQEIAATNTGTATEALKSFKPELAKRTVRDLFVRAAMVLAGIIVMPFLIRLIFFFILAPLAERRAAIRIAVPGHDHVPIPPSPASRVSIPVRLQEGEELLVRQDYLQTTSLAGRLATQWMIDWRTPLSSYASGLVFLTRIRGDGESTTVSAIRDPFAELTEVVMPEGSACVLHARSLVAVVQPIGRHIRITRHWRLFSLNAWLTLQLRYLAFHGPGRLIVMGGRGIRLEQAERGRVFGQDQLVGFSADLSYSVTRTETFWPYFFGREPLLKDKVREGHGILIIEEAPLSSRKGKGVRHGLEGAFDAGLKAFGL